jgi:hypothetical protein
MQMHVSIPSANGRVGNDKAMSSIHFGRRCDLSATAGRWNTAKQAIFASGAHYRQQIILKPAPLPALQQHNRRQDAYLHFQHGRRLRFTEA